MGFLFLDDLLLTKSLLRKKYRDLRRCVLSDDKTQASVSISHQFLNCRKIFNNKKQNIAAYLAHDGELDLSLLIQQLWQKNSAIFLPVIDHQNSTLLFAHYTDHTVMRENQFHIQEPEAHSFTPVKDLDIAFIPVVAFNRQGARLGMGKGYYDRSFAFRREKISPPLLIGVAYAVQECDELVTDPWDVSLDAILTENELFFCR